MTKFDLPASPDDMPPKRRLKTVTPLTPSSHRAMAQAAVLADARDAGLLNAEKTEHFSFRAPPGLIEAAKRESGLTSATELGLYALAMLARPDPFVEFMKKNRGRLGKDHNLEY